MKNKIVLVPFPFDDLSSNKVRPVVCLTSEIQPYNHVVVAFITSKMPIDLTETDLIIDASSAGFSSTGLKVSSTIRFHRLVTINKNIIRRELGELPNDRYEEVAKCLRSLFEI